jgi:Protein of unknown function (DUF732)
MTQQPPPAYQPEPPVKSNKTLYIVLASVAFAVIGIAVGVMGALGVFNTPTQPAPARQAAVTVSPTDKFLQLAHADKIPAADDTMVSAAQDFCSSMPFETGAAAQLYLDGLALGGMDTATQAHTFEYDAAQAFCPDKMNDLSGP